MNSFISIPKNKISKQEIDNQIIILGDCLKVLTNFNEKSIDMIITSPPYNIGVKYNTYKDKKENIEYLTWLEKIFIEIKRVLKDEGSVFLNVGSTNINPWVSLDVAQTIRKIFILQNHIIWTKSISINSENHGHYNPINSERFLHNMFEDLYHFTKNGNIKIDRKSIGVPYKDKINLKAKTITEDIRCRGNTWFIPYKTIHSKNQKGNHPAIFPEKLVEWCIKLHGFNKDTIVCDPFLGSGTTLMVTKKLGVKGIGIEIDKEYFDYAFNKVTNFF